MTKQEFEQFKQAIEHNLKGLEHISTGACPGCDECGLSDEPSDHERDLAGEPSFSWCACECCGSSLGGDRHPAHGVISDATKTGQILHFLVCSDCLYYLNYGALDDTQMAEMEG